MEEHLRSLTTELRNEKTMNIDSVNTMEVISAINKEDFKVAAAVQEVLPEIETVVEWACESLKKGGRLIYIGAGTSGRLGVLDAVECPPTFSTPPDRVLGIIAGGENAFVRAVEGAEDKEEFGECDLIDVELTANDTVIGIAASGRTPYVRGALRYARKVGAKAVALSCNKNASITEAADIGIEVVVGPEVLTGSTRMKAATAHKMVLNMISTATMIRLGKVYENLMVDVNVSNQKLKDRAISIIETVTNADYDQALNTLEKANNQVKPAIVMIKTATDYEKAMELLENADGDVRKAISIYED
ncbi:MULTISPECIES: N-acetylmuramic acid 6-phosphate etherase [Bacillaceae]|jgi:N-acetylmuramic acid 6-phosphate etherase|uniref:N-acetylmuramic acid 6-phosphate etherase n=1 Tax=Bacillaceae TaxID=186817 RepID=UPI000BF80800|nr:MULTISPECIES: N-acetylmuramic acid 6-phosphate etherase [Bacillaceae]PEZ80561.1 N-acetylmuramic acid 6-phosphate etherase [Bacillus sp. AFS017274]